MVSLYQTRTMTSELRKYTGRVKIDKDVQVRFINIEHKNKGPKLEVLLRAV